VAGPDRRKPDLDENEVQILIGGRSPQDRMAYEDLKRELARRDCDDMNDYAEAKTDLITTILARAAR
jgi:GrpB-like predicted nucleotidyltransferase (UPF0157 family)